MTDEEQLKALEEKWKGKSPERGSKEYADMMLDRIRYRRIKNGIQNQNIKEEVAKNNLMEEAREIFSDVIKN